MEQSTKLKIDLKTTTPVKSEDGNLIFQEGFILRKASRFITGGAQDAIVPIPVFFDIVTGMPLKDTLPKELWSEFGYTDNEPVVETLPGSPTQSPTLQVVK